MNDQIDQNEELSIMMMMVFGWVELASNPMPEKKIHPTKPTSDQNLGEVNSYSDIEGHI